MALDAFSRTELLIGPEALARLQASRVAIFGLGGVGSWAAEALARAGVGGFLLVDDDSVCVTNINRQIIALRSTVGRPKVEVMRERILAINPDARVDAFQERYEAETGGRFFCAGSAGEISYVVDAIDSVSSKIDLILRSQAAGIPIMSAMGAGNKLDPTRFEVADIFETSVCPLARVMRHELRRRGVKRLKVVYSREEPLKADAAASEGAEPGSGRWSVPASISFVPPVAGFIIAAEVVKELIGG
jgi:tRNA A37 threonylcarbamoyladenosine dehydratase